MTCPSPLRALRSRSRTRGMTLIEILIVVGIILILMALLGMGMRTAAGKAKSKATKALIGRLQTALESYFAEFRDYPPDGYDAEGPGVNVNVDGVAVGSPMRRVRGTASLIYFLCRPLVKISFMGDPSDPRSVVKRPAGPFMTLEASNVSRPEAKIGGEATRFDPGYPWTSLEYWGPVGGSGQRDMITCEIIDAFFHPLVYDKVKTYKDTTDTKYFQAQRFHYYGSPTFSGIIGGPAHPDRDFLASMPTTASDERLDAPDWPDFHPAGTSDDLYNDAATTSHGDPRFAKWYTSTRYGVGAPADPNNAASGGSHCPRNIGGYDLWSAGGSWTNTRDDITSWE